MRPSKPSVRSASAVLAPASPAPTMANVRCAQSWPTRPRRGADPARARNSARDRGSRAVCRAGSRWWCSCRGPTPRSVMHMCSASITTPTPRGCSCVLQPVGDLPGQPLLYLRPAGEQLDHPGQLGQAQDPLARQVADVCDADERQHVVLADRVHRDVSGEHQLVVALVVGERREVERARAEHLRRRRGPCGAVCPAVDARRRGPRRARSGTRRRRVRPPQGGRRPGGRGGTTRRALATSGHGRLQSKGRIVDVRILPCSNVKGLSFRGSGSVDDRPAGQRRRRAGRPGPARAVPVRGRAARAGQPRRAAEASSAPPQAKFHLDRLAEDGLLETEYRRLSGRRGPGAAAREALPAPARQFAVTLPDGTTNWRQLMAEGVDAAARTGSPCSTRCRRDGAAAAGPPVGATAPARDPARSPHRAALAAYGYEPRAQAEPWCWPTARSTHWPRSTPNWSAG